MMLGEPIILADEDTGQTLSVRSVVGTPPAGYLIGMRIDGGHPRRMIISLDALAGWIAELMDDDYLSQAIRTQRQIRDRRQMRSPRT